MLTELKQGSKVVGVKQTKRAVNDGKAARVFLAEDADPRVTAPVEALCAEKQIPVERVPQMKELGSAWDARPRPTSPPLPPCRRA